MSRTPSVFHVDRLDLTLAPKPWAFAEKRRGEIDAHFAMLQRAKPALWNGRVLLLCRHTLDAGVFRGTYLETDYASFSAWHAWGLPDADVYDSFGAAAILSADGAFLLGVMGPHTFNAGRIYCPSGTPDPSDVIDGKIDLESSVRRELNEETGLDVAEFSAEPGWTTVITGPHIVHNKVLRSRLEAEPLRARILAMLAGQRQPELSDIRVVRGLADVTAAMPDFVVALLAHRFAGG
jgi:hypothetical protein